MTMNDFCAIHELKTWPVYYQQVRNGAKPFDLRKHDRAISPGDLLILREWDPDIADYTGYVTCAVVTCVVADEMFLQPGYVALGIRVLR
jgi:hypothetical protein